MKTNFLFKMIFILFLLLRSEQSFAQNGGEHISARNAIYVELGGNGIFYSVNYERILYQKNSLKLQEGWVLV